MPVVTYVLSYVGVVPSRTQELPSAAAAAQQPAAEAVEAADGGVGGRGRRGRQRQRCGLGCQYGGPRGAAHAADPQPQKAEPAAHRGALVGLPGKHDCPASSMHFSCSLATDEIHVTLCADHSSVAWLGLGLLMF